MPILSTTLNQSEEISPLKPYSMESTKTSDPAMRVFASERCLFCPATSPTFLENVAHMQNVHGLFVPYKQHILVDLETLFRYLHLVIFDYRECIYCGTERSTIQGVQHHMVGKGHCKFEVRQDSEFADFYDFSRPQIETEDNSESEDDAGEYGEKTTQPDQKPLQIDQDSLRLPSGRLISKKSSKRVEPSISQLHRQTQPILSQLDHQSSEAEVDHSKKHDSSAHDGRSLTRREKRQQSTVTYQLANLSASDRSALMHLSASEQRSLIATQHRFTEKVQKEESRRQRKIDRKGNKNLYAYWNTETPVYQCG
ncbi:C2H2 zinc finger transcription factor [Fusarium heterosporum]|uniref:C2H2 zinc finger transcription factor n=1 Tax=Fusarium heterosporum TaxID=42747 RepID=A0A8H5TDN7_FUSHE|nr:C2H2 zinc finger transcription factor [Fusarium heterosporum]